MMSACASAMTVSALPGVVPGVAKTPAQRMGVAEGPMSAPDTASRPGAAMTGHMRAADCL